VSTHPGGNVNKRDLHFLLYVEGLCGGLIVSGEIKEISFKGEMCVWEVRRRSKMKRKGEKG
jgi:hypothetical protein